jgi:hypothetical protein
MVAAIGEGNVDEIDTWLASIGPGEVRTLFVGSAPAAMAQLRVHADATASVTVVHCWRRLPDVHAVVDETVAALARAAFDAWPDWYPGAPRRFVSGNGTEAAVLNDAALRAVVGWRAGVNIPWLRAAVARCAERRVPLLADFAATVQARQLSIALSSEGPIVAMALDAEPEHEGTPAPEPSAPRLHAFASTISLRGSSRRTIGIDSRLHLRSSKESPAA